MSNNENQLDPRLLGIGLNLNPFAAHDSASRQQMFCSHVGQALVIDGSNPRRIQTGAEREVGKYTFSITMPVDANIIKVIQKYPPTGGYGSIKENPTYVILYENIDTNEIDVLMVERFHTMHTTFGFEYVLTENAKRIHPGQMVPAGTVIAHSSSVKSDGNYCYGREVQTAYMSIPQVIEDGFVISKTLASQLTTRMVDKRIVSWGREYYPLNLYGDKNHYKPFPDIGDKIRDDGLLIGLRQYDPALGVIEMTPEALMEPDGTYDKLTYALAGATVYDVDVVTDLTQNVSPSPVGMNESTDKYLRLHDVFFKDILKEYRRLAATRKDQLHVSPQFQQLVVRAMANDTEAVPYKVKRRYRRIPLDDRRVEIKYAKKIEPTIGYKLTDAHGGKGVIVDIWPDENMPVDKHGVRADLIMDGISVVKRLNVGQLYEQYINATSDMVSRNLKQMVSAGTKKAMMAGWDYLLRYYQIVSPLMYDVVVREIKTPDDKQRHLDNVLNDCIYLYLPPNSPNMGLDLLNGKEGGLVNEYPLDFGPVAYTGRSGVPCVTKDPIIIGSKYVMLLEAVPDNWSSVSTAKLQHHGIPAKLTMADKNAAPTREQPVRIAGESEVRLFNAAMGPEVTADILDGSNSPSTHKSIIRNILEAGNPSNIDEIVDRIKVPRGNSRPVRYVEHILQCAGIAFNSTEYDHEKD